MHCPRLRTFSSAGFPALSLVLVSKNLILMNWPMLQAGHPRWKLAALFKGFWNSQMLGQDGNMGTHFSGSSVPFWTTGRNGVHLLAKRMFHMGMVDSHLSSCNREKSLFVKATVNSLWMLLQFSEKKYSPLFFIFPLHLYLKTGNWSRASKYNFAQRLSLPPNDTGLFFFIEAVFHSLSLN